LRDLSRRADHGSKNLVESVEEPGTGDRLFFKRGKLKQAGELLPVEAGDGFVADDRDRNNLKT
jgi:hypothetical protein